MIILGGTCESIREKYTKVNRRKDLMMIIQYIQLLVIYL